MLRWYPDAVIFLFSYDAPTLHLQKISGFLTRRYAPLQKTLILEFFGATRKIFLRVSLHHTSKACLPPHFEVQKIERECEFVSMNINTN